MTMPEAPKKHKEFVERFPELGEAWELTAKAAAEGPLDERTVRLLKLAITIGAMREGAVHSSVRKAKAIGITDQEIDQVVAIAASTLGFPATVAVYTWVKDVAG